MFRHIARRAFAPIRKSHIAVQSCMPTRKAHFDATVGLTDDQLAFQELAQDFANNELAPFAAEWDENKIFPEDTLRKAAQLGFGGLFVQEEHGGIGAQRMDGTVVFEALSTGCVSTTAFLTIHNMCAWMIDSFGSDHVRSTFLPALTQCDLFISYCLTEPNSGSDAASLQTKAVKKGNEYILNGTKAFISGGGRSDLYVVMARTGDAGPKGISTFLIPKDATGLSFGANEKKMGWNSQPTSMVIMEDCVIPEANLIGQEGQGFTFAMKGLDGGRVNIASTSLGGAQRALNEAITYTSERKQFNKSLQSNQYIQFKLADMAIDLQAARFMVHNAARMMDAKDPRATQAAAMAKRFATDTCSVIANDALQLHGGYGYLKDYPLERIVRDVRVNQILEGTNEIMRLITAKQLLK